MTGYTDGSTGNAIADPRTYTMIRLADGSLLAATDAGAVWMPDPDLAPGQGIVCADWTAIRDMVFDPVTGVVYAGTDDFVMIWDLSVAQCDVTFLDPSNSPLQADPPLNPPDQTVRAVALESGGGAVWFGTDHPTLARLDTVTGDWTVYRPAELSATVGDRINDLAVELSGGYAAAPVDRDIVWAGVDGGGNNDASVIRRDEAMPSWVTWRVNPDGLPDPVVEAIVIGADGTKWLATPGGIVGYGWR